MNHLKIIHFLGYAIFLECWNVKMKALRSFEMSINVYQSIL